MLAQLADFRLISCYYDNYKSADRFIVHAVRFTVDMLMRPNLRYCLSGSRHTNGSDARTPVRVSHVFVCFGQVANNDNDGFLAILKAFTSLKLSHYSKSTGYLETVVIT